MRGTTQTADWKYQSAFLNVLRHKASPSEEMRTRRRGRSGETVRMGLRDSFRDIDDRTDDLREVATKYPKIWGSFFRHYKLSQLYHENALEGVVVSHAELTAALKGRPLTPDTFTTIRNLQDAMGIVNEAALDFGPIDFDLIKRIHGTLLTGDKKAGGEFPKDAFRKDIPLHRAYFHEIAQPSVIEKRFNQLLNWAQTHDPDDDDAIRFAAHFHHEFMRIFPFTKHTGKTGRLLVNYILMRHGYIPVIFHATERQRYYDTLRLGKKDMEALLTDMMNNCVENGLRYVRNVLEEEAKRSPLPRHRSSTGLRLISA